MWTIEGIHMCPQANQAQIRLQPPWSFAMQGHFFQGNAVTFMIIIIAYPPSCVSLCHSPL